MNINDQVSVSRADLNRLVSFNRCLGSAFDELHALFITIYEKTEDGNPRIKSLSGLGSTHASNWQDYCLEEDELLLRLEAVLSIPEKEISQ